MPSLNNNRVIIAAAGSRKTQYIIDSALADSERRVLITTYTNENLAQIVRRIEEVTGVVPPNISIVSWFPFLINQAARPYQSSIIGEIDFIRSLNFHKKRFIKIPRTNPRSFYCDKQGNLYRDAVADFVCQADDASDGAVVRRLAMMYDDILIDELQDLVGYDLRFLDKLFASPINIVGVGDPRQHTFATNNVRFGKKYRRAGLLDWLYERKHVCTVETRSESWRCNQQICDWADRIYPSMPATTSRNTKRTGHDGVFKVAKDDVPAYVAKYNPMILRDKRTSPTMGLPAMNFGVAKGSTFDRVLIFPTQPMLDYLKVPDPSKLKAPERLYVAVTRARFSVAFVVNTKADADYIP